MHAYMQAGVATMQHATSQSGWAIKLAGAGVRSRPSVTQQSVLRRANGSLLTWNAARKTKQPEIYSRCCITSPRRLCSEPNKFPYVDWVQTGVLQTGLFACVARGTAEQ